MIASSELGVWLSIVWCPGNWGKFMLLLARHVEHVEIWVCLLNLVKALFCVRWEFRSVFGGIY